MKAELFHESGMSFKGLVRGHTVLMDAKAEHGGTDRGPSPKELLLESILGCTAMDIVSLLKKHRIEPLYFKLIAEGETTETYPKIFQSIELVFDLQVRYDDPETERARVLEAAALSMSKYCGVSAMIAPTSPIYYTIRINGEIEYRGEADFPTQVKRELPGHI